MLTDFFQVGPIPADQMLGRYSPGLVVLSYMVAVFASYIALDLTGRLRDISNTRATMLMWLIGGAIAMGAGIWSMHFIGMLSFSMPMMTVNYDLFWTSLSLFVAILASGFALYLLKAKIINWWNLAFGGIILGIAIASMHYTGMEAMRIQMGLKYLPGLFLLSIIIAIVASEAALWLALKSNQVVAKIRVRLKIASAVIMGLAICGMHYTGMAAAIFTPKTSDMMHVVALNPTYLSISIAAVTFVILSIAFFASSYKEAINQSQLETARQLGMAEVAASVLHNVGNVLNSVNVSANLVAEKLQNSKVKDLRDLNTLINNNRDNLAEYISSDERGKKIPQFLNLLTDHYMQDNELITTEIKNLLKNIQHIKDIISMQQGLSRIKGIEQIVNIDELFDEALLITGLDRNPIVEVQKHFDKIKPFLIDKVKVMQILVNILSNAKDALKESTKQNKEIDLCAFKNGKFITIQIKDNGIGIPPENLKKIFLYGFSTKQSGHGYGIHSCALAINEMGGTMNAESEGQDQGATFTITFPYKIPRQ